MKDLNFTKGLWRIMCYLTYNLKCDSKNSDIYYKKVEDTKDKVLGALLNRCKIYIDDFSEYIKRAGIEKIRTDKEYFIELLLIGVLKNEYDLYTGNVKISQKIIFDFLNKCRSIDLFKVKADKLRGKMNTKILLKKNEGRIYPDYTMNRLIQWLKCSGDFEEEVIRLSNWRNYLKNKEESFREEFLKFVLKLAFDFRDICEKYLNIYVRNVDKYIKEYRINYENREDVIYCGKGKIQYYFNMVCSEIMNDVYRNKFLNTKYKLVFLPACMRQQEKKCMSIKSERGYKCKGCSPLCNINNIRKQGKIHDFQVNVIPHETDLSSLEKKDNRFYGIIGIACVLNLISGGFKALRLGFIPQCVTLDEVGCQNHWFLKKGRMTEINEERLLSILNK